jgi:cell division transport system permease protein
VVIYLNDDTPKQDIRALEQSIALCPEVQMVRFISKEKALTILRTSLQGQDGILDGLATNPLPASLEVVLKEPYLNPEGVELFIKRFDKHSSVSDIEYGQKWLERFSAFFGMLQVTGFTLGGLLFLFTLFIISNTIKLMVYNRRDEIEIMRFVGATARFIRMPFCIEGILQGLIGSLMALLFIFAALHFGLQKVFLAMQFYLDSSSIVLLDLPVSLYVILLGAVLGLSGSLLSLSSIEEMQA